MKSPLESLEATFGSSPADRFDQLNLIALRGTWEATMTVRTVNRYTRIVRSAFRWGVQRGLVPQSTWVALTAVEALKVGRCRARPDGKVGPVSDEDVERTVVKLDRTYPTVAAMVRLQRLTGMRPSEVCSLRPMDLDRSGPIWSYIVPPEVNKEAHRHRPRPVQIGPRAQVVLLPFLGGPADQPAFRPHPYRIKRRQAWPGFPTDTYRKAIRRATERAGVSPWSPNQLRHAAATQVRKEKGLDAARAYLGHSESSTTEIYAVRDVEIARKVAEEMG
jgi:integrase